MSEHDLENVLRRFYRERVPEQTAAPRDLRARVAAIPDTTPQTGAMSGKGPLVLIAAVAMLSTLLLTFAIAGGTGLLRLPTAVVAPSPSAAVRATPIVLPSPAAPIALAVDDEPLQYCDRSIDDGVVLRLTPGDWSKAPELLVFDDGRVLTGSPWPMGFDDQWQQRRLTDTGLDAVLNAVAAASLPNCQSLYAGEGAPDYQLIARLDGSLLSVSSSDRGLRRVTAEQQAALSALFGGLTDLDTWITPDQWAEGDWQPYRPDRWQLRVTISWDDTPPCDPAIPLEQNCRPSGHLLPDGSDLMAFGAYYPGSPSEIGVAYRCGVVNRSEAEAMLEALELSTTEDERYPEGAYQSSFRVGPSRSGPGIPPSFELDLALRGVLPHQPACVPYTPPTPADAPPDALPDLDPCHYVPASARRALDMSPRSARSMNGYWSWCLFYAQSGDLDMYLRVRPTTTGQAKSYARSLFAEEGLTSESVAGGTVYFNGCFEPGSGCRPAVALSAEPYLLVLAINWPDSRDDLRSVAESILREGLPADDPAATP